MFVLFWLFLPRSTPFILFKGYFKIICKHSKNVCAYTGGRKQNLLRTSRVAAGGFGSAHTAHQLSSTAGWADAAPFLGSVMPKPNPLKEQPR